MKRRDLIKDLKRYAKEQDEEFVLTHGSSHDKVVIGDRWTTVPRHNEIDDFLVKKIREQIGMD